MNPPSDISSPKSAFCNLQSEICNPKSLGFTLIELLVVITIIMVLAGLLFPVFGPARAKAQQTSCASNLRQCAIALRMYRDEYDYQFPPQNLSLLKGTEGSSPRSITGPEAAIWIGQLYPYLRSMRVMQCSRADLRQVDQFNDVPHGYGINSSVTLFIPGPGGGG